MKKVYVVFLIIAIFVFLPIVVMWVISRFADRKGLKQKLKDVIDQDFNNDSVMVDPRDYVLPKKTDKSELVSFVTNGSKADATDSLDILNERQKDVYYFIMKNGEVNMRKLNNKFKNVTSRTLRRDLTKLVKSKLIDKTGSTKSASYFLRK